MPRGCPGGSEREKEVKKKEKSTRTFDFRKALIEYGADENLIDEWMKVRKAKKAVNTQTAYNGFIKQVQDSTINIDDILKLCVENSWKGFNRDWEQVNQLVKKVPPKWQIPKNTHHY